MELKRVEDEISKQEQLIKKMRDYIALSLRRENISEELPNIRKRFLSTQQLVHEALNGELNTIDAEYNEVMRRMRRQQAIILDHLLSERRRELSEAETEQKQLLTLLTPAAKAKGGGISAYTNMLTPAACAGVSGMQLPLPLPALFQGTAAVTPKMTITAYKASPLVKRHKYKSLALEFLEFDVQVTQQQFDTIPKYMRGRETLQDLNNFLEHVIVPCFNEKYKLMYRERGTVQNPSELELWKLYNDQVALVPGRNFITAGDISRKLQRLIDKKLQSRITMLRHVGVLQEQRVQQTICYVWLSPNPK